MHDRVCGWCIIRSVNEEMKIKYTVALRYDVSVVLFIFCFITKCLNSNKTKPLNDPNTLHSSFVSLFRLLSSPPPPPPPHCFFFTISQTNSVTGVQCSLSTLSTSFPISPFLPALVNFTSSIDLPVQVDHFFADVSEGLHFPPNNESLHSKWTSKVWYVSTNEHRGFKTTGIKPAILGRGLFLWNWEKIKLAKGWNWEVLKIYLY